MMFVSKLFKDFHGITVQEYGNTMVWFVQTSVTVEQDTVTETSLLQESVCKSVCVRVCV